MNQKQQKVFSPKNLIESQKSLGFTLVELIVVVTILAILATIGFVSYSSYLTGVRDTNRLAQLVSISDGLELYRTKNNLPLPDDNVEVQADGTTIGYQGYAGANTLETIDFTKGGKDPRDDQYFTYYLTKDRKYYQLMGFLEESLDTITQFNNTKLATSTYAIDYEDRIVTVYGRKLGVLTNATNTPIQEIDTVTSIGKLDIAATTTSYKAHISDDELIEGTGAILQSSLPNYSCKRLRQAFSKGEGSFSLLKDGNTKNAYCSIEYPNEDFVLSLGDGDMEDLNSTNWLSGDTAASKITTQKNSGNYGLQVSGNTKVILSEDIFLINPNKSYKLSGYFKSGTTPLSRIYFGFYEYDEYSELIANHNVNVRYGTETTLTSAVSTSDTSVAFYCDDTIFASWNGTTVTHRRIAFNTDNSGNYSDLPNYNTSDSKNDSSAVTRNGNICTFTFTGGNSAEQDYPIGTNIRLHISGGSRNYVAAPNQTVPNLWTKYEGTVLGVAESGASNTMFRPGTKFVRPFVYANRAASVSGNLMYIDDIKVEEI